MPDHDVGVDPDDLPPERVQRQRSRDRYAPPSVDVARKRQILAASVAVIVVVGLIALGASLLSGGSDDTTADGDAAADTAG